MKTPPERGGAVHCGGEQFPLTESIPDTQTGWTYSQAGTPCAYVMPLDDPADATIIPFPSWWEALRFAVSFARENHCEYVGGRSERSR